ncbi:redox-sensing transcriptional repressor Rex [Enterococcus songbeiensis]|uniref:redox-sensing transcriptional repressor Rex n=1 Tax=Enterococcus songbeiensis TaxID=2559927 RepID=UPI0010F9E6AB|nr:redox-sensing transcriptional repressor Rex [Enterococcus songbeiensis]
MVEETKLRTIPKATAKRLPLYLRYLKMLKNAEVTRIKSKEFSELTQIPSATIRRDFSHLGELGRSGYGYEVSYLIEVFNSILDTNDEKRIALIGFGNLGKALANNNFRRNENLTIVSVFDSNPEIIGKEIDGHVVQDVRNLAAVVKEKELTVAISTVPSHYSQWAIDQIVAAGITAILNFAPDRVEVPANVHVQYIDLTTELQTLIFFDQNYQDEATR